MWSDYTEMGYQGKENTVRPHSQKHHNYITHKQSYWSPIKIQYQLYVSSKEDESSHRGHTTHSGSTHTYTHTFQ